MDKRKAATHASSSSFTPSRKTHGSVALPFGLFPLPPYHVHINVQGWEVVVDGMLHSIFLQAAPDTMPWLVEPGAL
jgi:hypothetical protein